MSAVACYLISCGFHLVKLLKRLLGMLIILEICFIFPLSFIYSLAISFDETSSGVACDLESRGFHVLCKATEEVVGHVKPYSITGTLPLIRELQVRFLFNFILLCLLSSPPPFCHSFIYISFYVLVG